MRFDLAAIAHACAGSLHPADAGNVLVSAVTIDSRSLATGALFVPLLAERDGHDFIAAAVRSGAAAFLTSRQGPVEPTGVPAVLVGDTGRALTDLGIMARSHMPDRVIGVTGSVGKTSVKDLTAAALSTTFLTTSSKNSFNNELGVPLTLLNGPDGSAAAVVEMGARGVGHIRALCAVARPTVGIVTRVAPAHLELFGSLQDVARAKGELIEALPPAPLGVAVLNHDDPLVRAMAGRGVASILSFGLQPGADLRATAVRLDEQARATFELASPWGSATVRLTVSGAHMVPNTLAALAAALAIGVPLAAAVDGVTNASLSPWRMEVTRTARGVTLLNDAYNASPVATRAAFDALDALAARGSRAGSGPPAAGGVPDPGRGGGSAAGANRRVAVLGQMAELGPGAAAAHREVAEDAAGRGIELFSVGTDLYRLGSGGQVWADVEEAAVKLLALGLGPGDVVLFKASRVVGLERLAAMVSAASQGGPGAGAQRGGGV